MQTTEQEQAADDIPLSLENRFPPHTTSLPLRRQSAKQLQRRLGNRAARSHPLLQRRQAEEPPAREVATDFTGRYQDMDAVGSLQVNQAGRLALGWLQSYTAQGQEVAGGFGRQRQERPFSATFVGEEQRADSLVLTYRYRFEGETGSRGRMLIYIIGGGEAEAATPYITLYDEQQEQVHSFSQSSAAARPSAGSLLSLPLGGGADEIRSHVVAPVHPGQREELQTVVAGPLQRRVAEALDLPATARFDIMDDIEQSFDQQATAPYSLWKPFALDQGPVAAREIRRQLRQVRLTHGGIDRSLYSWLIILIGNGRQALPNVRRVLKLPAGQLPTLAEQSRQHTYHWRYDLAGWAGDVGVAGGAVFTGKFTFWKSGPQSETWGPVTYWTALAGGSLGLSAGVQVGQSSSGSFESPYAYGPRDFKGLYSLATFISGGIALTGGAVWSVSEITFYGTGTYPPAVSDASGKTEILGLYIGAEGGKVGGYLYTSREAAVAAAKEHARQRPPGEEAEEAEMEEQALLKGVAHFGVDSAELTQEGLQQVRRAAALYRAELTSAESTLLVEGHTSTTASTAHNDELSEARARAVLHGLQTVLGPLGKGIRARPDREIVFERRYHPDNYVIGWGEQKAQEAGLPDDTESREWRRVDVKVNGRIVISLH